MSLSNSASESQKNNVRFECTVNALLLQILESNPDFMFKFDKWKKMNGESIQRNLVRKTDGKKSHPDAEAYYNGKILCIDAKNYSKSKIDFDEVTKLVGDTWARRSSPGILVLQENSCLDEKAYKECKKRKIIIVQLEKIPGKNEHYTYDLNYYNESNKEKLENALTAQFTEVPKVDVLFTKNGYVDRRSKAWRDGNFTEEQLEKYGVRFIEGTNKVDQECEAFKEYEKHRDALEQKKKASNYSHKKKTQEYEEREQKKEKKLKDSKSGGEPLREEEKKDDAGHKTSLKLNKNSRQKLEEETKYPEYIPSESEKERKYQEYLERQAYKEKKQEEYLQRQAEKERKHQEYLEREAKREAYQAMKERKHQEFLQREAMRQQRKVEKERKHKEYLEREAKRQERKVEKEKKHQEYLEREAKRQQYKAEKERRQNSYSSKPSGSFSSFRSSAFTSGTSYSNVAVNPTGPMKSNGTPDMRYSGNRQVAHLKMDGTPDMRFKCNR